MKKTITHFVNRHAESVDETELQFRDFVLLVAIKHRLKQVAKSTKQRKTNKLSTNQCRHIIAATCISQKTSIECRNFHKGCDGLNRASFKHYFQDVLIITTKLVDRVKKHISKVQMTS